MIDSHCHLDHDPLFENLNSVLDNSKKVGIDKILTISTTNNSYKNVVNASDICVKILDDINAKMGKMTLFYGSQGLIKNAGRKKIENDKWRMRSFYRSPFYTTNWADILKVS